MPRLFKRSAKVPIAICHQNDNHYNDSDEISTYRARSDHQLDIVNENRLIENESKAERSLTGPTSSVSGRVSNFVSELFGKMGRNRRGKTGKSIITVQHNQQPQQQSQPAIQTHLKKIHSQNDKQQPPNQPQQQQQQQQQQQTGRNNNRQTNQPFKKTQTDLHSNELTSENSKFSAVNSVKCENKNKKPFALNDGDNQNDCMTKMNRNNKDKHMYTKQQQPEQSEQPEHPKQHNQLRSLQIGDKCDVTVVDSCANPNKKNSHYDTFVTNDDNTERVICFVNGQSSASIEMKFANDYNNTTFETEDCPNRNTECHAKNNNDHKNNNHVNNNNNQNDEEQINIDIVNGNDNDVNEFKIENKMFLCSSSNGEDENRSVAKRITANPTPDSLATEIELCTSIINSKNNLNQNVCEQLKIQSENHNASSPHNFDNNNNEINIQNVGNVRSNAIVNCDDSSKRLTAQSTCISVELTEKFLPFVRHTDKKANGPLNSDKNVFNQTYIGPAMGQHQSASSNSKQTKQKSKNIVQNQQKNINNDTKSISNSNASTTVASGKQQQQQHQQQQQPQKQQGIQQTTIKTEENASQRDIWHDAPTQTQFYDKNKINFSNEFNEKLETETSSKQARIDVKSDSVVETVAIASDRTANETKDIFYETTSDMNDEQFSVGTLQYTGTDTKNVNGNNLIRSEIVSNGENNCERIDIETGSNQPNDSVDVTLATDYILTKQPNSYGIGSYFEPTKLNQSTPIDEQNENIIENDDAGDRLRKIDSTTLNKTTANIEVDEKKEFIENRENIECGAGESNGEQNCEKQPTKQQLNDDTQMEQNVLYRVDSYNSDDALDLSDIEETVINEHGKVIEIKTIFKQRSSAKKPNDLKSKSNSNDPLKNGLRTIGNRRRSNSISGSFDIEIVEYGLDTSNTSKHEQLSKQPIVVLADDDRDAIKLADLTDNSIAIGATNYAIDVIEIVQEDEPFESGSEEYSEEEIDDEIDEEEEENEEDQENEEKETATKDEINEKNKEKNVHLTNQMNVKHSTSTTTPATTKTTLTTPSNDDSDNVICVSVNGQPTQFNAPNHINLTNRIKCDSQLSVNEIEKSEMVIDYKNHDNSNNSNFSNSGNYNSDMKYKSSDQLQSMQQHPSKYSDDAMHLPDIVVGSTLNNSNGNSHINKKTIQLSRSPPKIVVNDTITWSSGTDETETISETYEELSEEEESEISQDNDKSSDSNKLNVKQTESILKQNNNRNESKERELQLLAQIDEANRNVADAQVRISELTNTITDLERQLTVKIWNVERLQAELDAAYKELNCVKSKLKLQEAELDASRAKYSDKEDDQNLRFNNLEADHLDLKQKLDRMQSLAISLQVQLNQAQSDLTDLRTEKERFERERNDERQALQDALDAAIIERAENDAKWQREYEQLRTLNSDREELLLQDCEWKLRSTERTCKDRVTAAEKAKTEAIAKSEKISTDAESQSEKLKHLKTYEAEVAALRGLTNEQRQSITFLTQQLEDIKARLDESMRQLDDSMLKIRKMAVKFASDLSDKDRETIARIDQVRGEVASMWEDRLLNEMLRLKVELETCHAEDRMEAVRRAQEEHIADVNQLKENFAFREQMLRDEIGAVKSQLTDRNRRLDEANEKADKQIMQIRMILNKSEQDHQREINAQISQHEAEMQQLNQDFDQKENRMKNEFERKIEEIKKRYNDDMNTNRAEMIAKLKREYEAQYEKFKADKEEEQQDMQRMYKRKLVDADVKIRDMEILHEREIKDIQNAHSMERNSLEKRDLHNSEEIETLHRKCRCLTKLFEEMRIRYERRDPRPEDIREMQELKSIIDAQDKDLRQLTERLREMQIHHAYENIVIGNDAPVHYDQSNMTTKQDMQSTRKIKKPNLNCDVIYEAENEDEESHAITV